MTVNIDSPNGEDVSIAPSCQSLADLIVRSIPDSVCMVVALFPRASLQVLGAAGVPESTVRSYNRWVQTHDKLTWRVLRGATASGETIAPDHVIRELGIDALVVAPMAGSVLTGYRQVAWIGRRTRSRSTAGSSVPQSAEAWTTQALQTAQRLLAPAVDQPQSTAPSVIFLDLNSPAAEQDAVGTLRYNYHLSADALAREARAPETPEGLVPPARWLGVSNEFGLLRPARIRRITIAGAPVGIVAFQPKAADWRRLSREQLTCDSEAQRMLEAVSYIADNFLRSPTLQEVAKQVHLSPYHFHRRFTEVLGITPKHLLLEFQVHMAKDLLVDGTESLKDVASLAGFAHQSHFTSRFKQATGLTPLRWKRLKLEHSTSTKG